MPLVSIGVSPIGSARSITAQQPSSNWRPSFTVEKSPVRHSIPNRLNRAVPTFERAIPIGSTPPITFKKRHSSYFKIVQAYQHHKGLFYNNKLNNEERGYIYSYSFALNPDNSEPSGTCNFSRVSNAKLILSINNKLIQGNKFYIRVFAVNYNVLHFENGMGFLIYK